MSIVTEKMFANLRPDLAPPRDAAGGVIISPLLDSKEAVFGEHIYVLVDQWEASPAAVDRKTLEDAKAKLLSWKTSHPGALSHPPTIDAINQLVLRIDTLLGAAPIIIESESVQPQNVFERWLVQEKFPREMLRGTTEAEMRERWELKRSYFITRVIIKMLQDGSFDVRKLVPIGGDKVIIQNTATSGDMQAHETSYAVLAESAGAAIADIQESKIATEVAEKMKYDIALIDTVTSGYNTYFEANQSDTTIASAYSIAKEGGLQSTFSAWGFDTLDALPALIVNEQTLELDTEKLSKRLLMAAREIIKRGRRTRINNGVTKLDKSILWWQPAHKIQDRNFFAHAILNGTSMWKKLRGCPGTTQVTKPIFPIIAAGDGESTEINFEQLAIDLSRNPASGKRDTIGSFSALFMNHFMAWANLEDAAQDNRPNSESPQGRPIGQNIFSRFLYFAEYMMKVVKEGRTGPTNTWGVGTIRKMLNGMLDSICFDGESLTERIVDNRTVAWINKKATATSPAVKGVVEKQLLPASFDTNWKVAVQRTALVFSTLANGFKEGGLQKIASFKLAEGQVTLNSNVIEALVTFFRLISEYRTFTEASPALAINRTELTKLGENVEDHLSGDFAEIRILGRDGQPLLSEPFYTRMPDFHDVTPAELTTWLQHPDSEEAAGWEMRWRNGQGEGWEQRPPNRNGLKRNVMKIVLDVDAGLLSQNRASLNPTQQREYDRALFCRQRNSPRALIERYLVSHYLTIIVRKTLEATTFKKEDWMGFFMLFSSKYKESYEHGGERGPWKKLLHEIGETTGIELLKTESPDIFGPWIFTPRQLYMILNDEVMGVKINYEEALAETKKFGEILGKLATGKR